MVYFFSFFFLVEMDRQVADGWIDGWDWPCLKVRDPAVGFFSYHWIHICTGRGVNGTVDACSVILKKYAISYGSLEATHHQRSASHYIPT